MSVLGNGLAAAGHHEEALSVGEAELSMMRRVGASEERILVAQTNLADTYHKLGRFDQALRSQRDAYSGFVKLLGEEHALTLTAGNNYAEFLILLQRSEEAKWLLRKMMPVARRVLGEGKITLAMSTSYARALHMDDGATLDDLREAVTTVEGAGRIARRVLGGAHPLTTVIERDSRNMRAALRAREMRQS
jgi:hypothetical protein